MRVGHWLAATAALVLAACQVAPPKPPDVVPPAVTPVYAPAAFAAIPGWSADAVDAAWPALLATCNAMLARPARAADWQEACAEASAMPPAPAADAARAFIERHFTAWRVSRSDGSDEGLVTGYYEPLLHGSRTPTAQYAVPLYAIPDDLLVVDLASLYPELAGKRVRGRLDGRKVVPYWDRAAIDAGKASLDGKAIAYVADPVEAFFLEIQGSGRIALADGSVMRVGYADQNGRPYQSVARVLVDRGELTLASASMQGIKAWGRDNPDKLPGLLEENPSYVFFREVPAPPPGSLAARIDGPIGSLGVPLLRERSIAVDTRYVPLGAPVFLDTTEPLSEAPLQRLTFAQDTGGAIRGISRADYFWGFGEDAGRAAGRMKQPGRMWILWPRDRALPVAR
jgi:membrane-bound lytic murein transglycosylase A